MKILTHASALRTMAQTCEFGDLKDSLIRDRIVCGIRDNNTRKDLLQERKLELTICIDKCKAAEVANERMKTMTGHEVNMVRKFHSKKKNSSNSGPSKSSDVDKNKKGKVMKCKFCCRTHRMKKGECPAWGKECEACGEMNHYVT